MERQRRVSEQVQWQQGLPCLPCEPSWQRCALRLRAFCARHRCPARVMLVLIGDVWNHGRRPGRSRERGASLTCRGGGVQTRRIDDDELQAEVRVAKKVEAQLESGSDDAHGKSDQLQRTEFAVAGPVVPSPDRKVAANRETFLSLATVVFCGRRRLCVASSCEPLLASFKSPS
jgi:hypothetical protein